ncbi:hypothetical protein HK104_005622, partial [Borealophlyctis nickersoniae]
GPNDTDRSMLVEQLLKEFPTFELVRLYNDGSREAALTVSQRRLRRLDVPENTVVVRDSPSPPPPTRRGSGAVVIQGRRSSGSPTARPYPPPASLRRRSVSTNVIDAAPSRTVSPSPTPSNDAGGALAMIARLYSCGTPTNEDTV